MIISLNNMFNLRKYAIQSTKALGGRAVDDSNAALKMQAEEELLMVAIDQAALSNAVFDRVSSEANVIASFVIQMWSNPSQTVSKRNYFIADKPETIYAASVTALLPGVTDESVSSRAMTLVTMITQPC